MTAHTGQAAWGVWPSRPAVLVPQPYIEHIEAAGGLPVLVAPSTVTSPAAAGEVLDRLDGLVLTGGPDIDPACYGGVPDSRTGPPHPERDTAELLLAAAALDRDLPVLGICRGMEVLAVAGGGRLHQHLPDVVGHDGHQPGPAVPGRHAVGLAPGSLAGQVLGDRVAEVWSYHHQGVADPGGFVATGWSEDDAIEVLEAADRRFVLGVLWHPELGEDGRLFRALVAAAGGGSGGSRDGPGAVRRGTPASRDAR